MFGIIKSTIADKILCGWTEIIKVSFQKSYV